MDRALAEAVRISSGSSGAQDVGEGGDFVIERQRPVKVPLRDCGSHGLGVQFQGARRIAVRGLLMDAQVLDGFQLLLGEHPLLAVNMGGGPSSIIIAAHFPSI